jgi:hypothetical protein
MRRGIALAVVAAIALAAAVLLAGRADPTQPVAVVGHTGTADAVPASTTAPPPAPAPTTTSKPKPQAAATRSTTVVRSDAGGLTVVNEGSATASSGGNTVIGPPCAQVNEGPVSAVGNSADVRIRP